MMTGNPEIIPRQRLLTRRRDRVADRNGYVTQFPHYTFLVRDNLSTHRSAWARRLVIVCGASFPGPRPRKVFDLGGARCAGHLCSVRTPLRS